MRKQTFGKCFKPSAVWIGLCASVMLAAAPAIAATQTSLVDPSFDPKDGAQEGLVESIAVQPDGKVLACGNFTKFNNTPHAYIVRLNPDGSVDETFMAHPSYWVRYIALQPDGKILIGGFFTTVSDQPRGLIARLNSDGSLDETFNPGIGAYGTLNISIVGNPDPFVFQIAVQPNGKILITGNFTNFGRSVANGIARLNPDGSLDTTFKMGSGFDRWGRSFTLQSNGQIIVTGWFNNYNNQPYNHMIRLNEDGTADPTFNTYFGDSTSCYGAVQLADGKYVVCGHSLNPGFFDERIRRLNPDGSIDKTFTASADEKVECIRLLPDGKILVAGYFGTVNGKHVTGVARLNPDGSLDETLQASIDNFVWTVIPQGEKMLLSGAFWHVDDSTRNGVVRIFSGPQNSVSNDPVSISAKWTNNKFNISCPTVTGQSYALQYKASLTDTNWLTLQNFTGNGATTNLVDNPTGAPQRFYRIMQQ